MWSTPSSLLARAASALVFLVLAAEVAADPRPPGPLTAVDLLEVPRLGEPQLSPDGTQILFTVETASWKANRDVGHIHRVNADGSGERQMTSGAEGESGPRWAPDGRSFAFLAKRPGTDATQAYLMANDGGEARALTHHPTSIRSLQWAKDGSGLFFLAPEPRTAEDKAKLEAKDDAAALDEDFKQVHLWRIALGAASAVRVTGGDFSITQYSLSKDGRRIVASRGPSPLFGDSEKGEIVVMDADGGNVVAITRNTVDEWFPSFSPDGAQVVFTSPASAEFQPYYPSRAFVAPAAGGAPRVLAPGFPYAIDRALFTGDGRHALLAANMGVHNEVFLLDLATQKYRQVTDGRHELIGSSFVPDLGRLVLAVDQPDNPGELWLYGLDGAPGRQVTHLSERYAREFKLGRQERIEWKGADGVTVEGLLHYPVDYEAGRRYPLVVQTHGGPRSSDRYSFGDWQGYVKVLAGRGYAVLQPNYRGSTGYGEAFLRDMVGGYFRNSHLDVLAGTDKVIAMGVADPERLAKMGWSAGGHMTNKIITFTDRFKAASSGAGAANWVSMYGQSDTRGYRDPWFGGSPWTKDARIDVFWDHSPLKYVAAVKTPTLFLVGERDVRVPPAQSYEMHRALKANGVPTKLYVAPREPHTWEELRHRLFKINAELDWFEKYVMGRTYTWETAPKGE
jgi:dipeptidyl aminopeptidase/acylaminoacyl peptidase